MFHNHRYMNIDISFLKLPLWLSFFIVDIANIYTKLHKFTSFFIVDVANIYTKSH